MTANPYEPPRAPEPMGAVTRGPFTLAGIAALLASGYWALLTLLLGFGAAAGSVSGFQVIMPCVLVVLYAMRGVQCFKGDVAAVKRLQWLHAVGAVFAAIQLARGVGFMSVLVAFKVAINVFGAVTAYLAARSHERASLAT